MGVPSSERRESSQARAKMPPIYPPQLSGTKAQQYMHRARMFREAAVTLPDYRNGEPFWPKYALITHAIELSLKAFAAHSIDQGKPPPAKEPKQHDLIGWYRLAVDFGLSDEPNIADSIAALNEIHFGHFTRYPQHPAKPLPDASVIADTVVDHFIFTFTQVINPR
jgi:hypothetical protein